MRAEAVKLGQALLDPHRAVTAKNPPPAGRKIIPSQYTIPYSKLCQQAGVGHVLRIVGSFLGEIAEWCSANGYPPLTALAVNARTSLPGEGYDGAGGPAPMRPYSLTSVIGNVRTWASAGVDEVWAAS